MQSLQFSFLISQSYWQIVWVYMSRHGWPLLNNIVTLFETACHIHKRLQHEGERCSSDVVRLGKEVQNLDSEI